jgi:hypothetical protein
MDAMLLGHSELSKRYKGGFYEKTPLRFKNSSNLNLSSELHGGQR